MSHDPSLAMSIVTTVLNVAGIFAAVHLWVSYRIGARLRVVWLLVVFITCAGLEAWKFVRVGDECQEFLNH
jgi:hypothetical protein